MYRPKQTESLFATDCSVIPECLTKNREMYQGNKPSLLLTIHRLNKPFDQVPLLLIYLQL